jgi:DNA polymerase-3 subunit gamma/tau
VLRDLEAHGRELLAVQVLGEVPLELRLTPERDRRLAEQAAALTPTDAVRLLDLVSAALDATANGAQARIQLELVLVKAAAPELDPSMAAVLSRIERLEGRGEGPSPSADRLRESAAVETPTPPASEKAAAGPPPPPPTGPDLDAALASWPAVVDLVRSDNAMLAGALDAARPVAVDEASLTLAFPSGASFLKRKAEQDDYRRAAAEALKAVTGRRLALRYELRDVNQDEGPVGTVLSGEELVRRFVEEFDAEEILEEESDKDTAN